MIYTFGNQTDNGISSSNISENKPLLKYGIEFNELKIVIIINCIESEQLKVPTSVMYPKATRIVS